MSAEALLSAVLLKYNENVEHGSISAMVRTASKHLPFKEEMIAEARFMNRFHTWCSLDIIPAKHPSSDELKRMVNSVSEIRQVVKGDLF